MNKYLLIFITFLVVVSIALYGTALAERNVIIGYHQKPDHADEDEIKKNGGNIKHSYRVIPAVSAKLSDKAIAKLKNNPEIAYIENDTILKAAVDEYDTLWGMNHIGARIVQNSSINGTGVKIAVLDTGIDYNHEDLRDNYKGGFNFAFNNSDPFDDSYNSHGTHVAGIIAAEKNGIGVVGIAPNSNLYAIKVLDGAGFGLASWVIAGIEWAVDNKMDIATMSLGSSPYDPDLQSLKIACDNAYNAGVLLVASAGNTNGGNVTYPAGFDSVIAVTATDQNNQKAYFSPVDPKIELSAPGVNINSTIKSTYAQLSGTSQATSHVTGTAALLISSHSLKDLNDDGMVNNKDVRLQLQRTAKDLGNSGKDHTYGYGLVDAQAAVLGITEKPKPIILTLNRTCAPPASNAKNISLSNGEYKITIRNHGLNNVHIDIFERGVRRKDLSLKYKFRSALQEVIFDLDVKGTTYDVNFISYGKPKTSAEIIIQEKG